MLAAHVAAKAESPAKAHTNQAVARLNEVVPEPVPRASLAGDGSLRSHCWAQPLKNMEVDCGHPVLNEPDQLVPLCYPVDVLLAQPVQRHAGFGKSVCR
jgi:hypothetical protein